MPTLREVQDSFRAGVFGSATTDWIAPGGLPAERRFAVYRNNTLHGLTEALRDGFPVINRLIGADCFAGVARRFITACPPRSGCLLDYGEAFATHLMTDPATRTLAYLADVAGLEWAWHLAFHASDEPAWTLDELGAVPAERQAALCWRLQPGARLLDSPWPLLRIFAANQSDQADVAPIDLNAERGGPILVFRPAAEVLLLPLSAGEFALLAVLATLGDLDRALAAALSAEPEFDFAAVLAGFFNQGVFAPPDLNPLPTFGAA